MVMQSSLPDSWVEKLFQKFEDFYGAKWAAQYGAFPRERVKGTWADELGGFLDNPQAIAKAIEAQKNSPFPPTLPEFLTLCRDAARRSGPQHLALPEPTISQEEADARRNKAAVLAEKMRQFAPSTAWAKKLRERYLSGERLLPIQIKLASEALGESWALNGVEISERLAA